MAPAPSAASPAAQSAAGSRAAGAPGSAGEPGLKRSSDGTTITAASPISGSTARNTHGQPSRWVRYAATGGPMKEGSTQAVEI